MTKYFTLLGVLLVCGALTQAQADERTFGDGDLPDFLKVFDTNDDGILDEEEIQAMKDAREERRDAVREHFDTDGDGTISAEEREAAKAELRERMETRRSERFAAADTDGSETLSPEEFGAIPAVARLAERHPEKVAAIFDRLDADDSGEISEAEFTSHLRMRHHRPRPGGGDGGGEEPPPPGDGGGDDNPPIPE